MTQSRAPLIVAIALLILPVLYVGSYLALVTPQARLAFYNVPPPAVSFGYLTHYRCGGDWAPRVYWLLEQLDRRLRPQAWIDNPRPGFLLDVF
jgi:hypothetical protein